MMLLFYVFSICIVVQTLFALWMLWASDNRYRSSTRTSNTEGLSIIICAHNEAAHLAQNIPLLLAQNHPQFEVIVVNDASDDDSAKLLAELSARHPLLKVVSISPEATRTLPGKKLALSKGVAAAQYEQLLLTDADCAPASNEWANIMSASLRSPKEIVAGYGAYKKSKGWLNVFIRWETMHSFLQYSSYAHSGMPYMAVGRNLACSKKVFLAAQSHSLWSSMPSGDDDLLIRLEGHRHNVGIEDAPESFTYSMAKTSFRDWLLQKQRHVSTGKLYKKSRQILLGAYALSHGLMWLLWIILSLSGYAYLISSLMLLRCLLVWSLWGTESLHLKERTLILFLPLCDIGWAIYNLILSPYIVYKTKKQWT
jgi:glycosyltransferase involved in cell wall biosynthesis